MYIGSLHANALKLVKATFDVLAELLCDAEAVANWPHHIRALVVVAMGQFTTLQLTEFARLHVILFHEILLQ
jgi:hypothetical protein